MNKYIFLLVLCTLVFLSPQITHADLGPKPTATIEVFYNKQIVSDINFNAQMLRCMSQSDIDGESQYLENIIPQLRINQYDESKKCSWFVDRFAWGGECANGVCEFTYMLPKDFKLAVFIPSLDKVFVTNEISREQNEFNSRYRVDISSDGTAKIISTTKNKIETVSLIDNNNQTFYPDNIAPVKSSIFTDNYFNAFFRSFLITILLELLVSSILIYLFKLPKKVLWAIILGNIISLPIVWFLFPLLKISVLITIIISEIFALLFEMVCIYKLNKQSISLKQSFILSLSNNFVSLFLGGLLYAYSVSEFIIRY